MVVYVQESGWTALFFAAKAEKSDVCKELVCKGAVTKTSLVSFLILRKNFGARFNNPIPSFSPEYNYTITAV